jgi:cysteine desulfurase / selenocysteine lyase
LRAETPGCALCTHFNNAGASLMPMPVLQTVIDHLELEARVGGYEAAEQREDALAAVYATLARLVNAHADEIAVLENATRAFDLAVYGLGFRHGDRILIGRSEYISHQLAYQQLVERHGVVVEAVADDEDGRLSLAALANQFDERVRLVAVGHVATNSGVVHPVVEVGEFLRGTNATYLVDACQSAGQLPLDVGEIGCHILTATGRKYLRGPRGTGFLYVRQELLERLEPPFADVRGARLGPQSQVEFEPTGRRFETWEFAHAEKLGLGAAADYALHLGLDSIAGSVRERAVQLRQALSERPFIDLLEPIAEQSGLVTFAVRGRAAGDVKRALAGRRINVSVAHLSDTPARDAPLGNREWIRASAHYFNTEDEIALLTSALDAISEAR